MTRGLRWFLIAWVGFSLVVGAGAFFAVDGSRRWLTDNLRPSVYRRAVWCWASEREKAAVAASPSRRDSFVVKTALLGATFPDAKRSSETSDNVVSWTAKLNRDTDRLVYVYGAFWSPPERQRLFDQVAASRPVCSASFGPG